MLYATISQYYDRIFPLNRTAAAFLSRFIKSGDSVLDIGCGTGSLTHALSKLCCSITGIDISSKMIQIARTRYPELEFLQTDIDGLQDRTFNLIFSTGNTLSYFDRAALERLSSGTASHLEPGGIWIYQTVNWDYLKDAKTYDFPVIAFDDGVFERKYVFQDDYNVDFHLTIKPSTGPVINETHHLFRYPAALHEAIHRLAGFRFLGRYLNWQGEDWSPETNGATISVFQKHGSSSQGDVSTLNGEPINTDSY